MKYPIEYWTGRMSGVLLTMSKFPELGEVARETCRKIVEEFEKDYGEEDEARDNDLHNSGYGGE